jgi:NAD+-dependent protein deacetylase sirtuin 4
VPLPSTLRPVEAPGASPATVDDLCRLAEGRRLVALTGAGCSTESGIPDYRSPGRRAPRQPIEHDAFLRKPEVRRRYWARATLGWTSFSRAEPNPAHRALAALEHAGHLAGVITQNVDRLHHQAGSRRVVELHGALADVRCLGCGAAEPRPVLHARLIEANPGWVERAGAIAPDGDAQLPEQDVARFRVVACVCCGGVLKPDVVFFGGNVAEPTLVDAKALLAEAQLLLVVGSSLAVYSGYRFARWAAERSVPVAIVNLGPTRADALASMCVPLLAGQALPALARWLGA